MHINRIRVLTLLYCMQTTLLHANDYAFEFEKDIQSVELAIHNIPAPAYDAVFEDKMAVNFPVDLAKVGNKGQVKMAFKIDPQGQLVELTTLESSHPDLEQEVVAAFLRTKFVATGVQQEYVMPLVFSDKDYLGGLYRRQEPYRISAASKKLPEHLRYDHPPQPKLVAPIVYPLKALKAGKTGKAKVGIVIDPEGEVRQAEILAMSDPDFGAAAKAAFSSWKFFPALKDNQKTVAILYYEMDFNHRNRDTAPSASENSILRQIKVNHLFPSPEQLDRVPKLRYAPLPKNISQVSNKVVIQFYVDQQGLVQLPQLTEFSDADQAWLALTAVKRWQFEVPTQNAQPTVAKFEQTLYF